MLDHIIQLVKEFPVHCLASIMGDRIHRAPEDDQLSLDEAPFLDKENEPDDSLLDRAPFLQHIVNAGLGWRELATRCRSGGHSAHLQCSNSNRRGKHDSGVNQLPGDLHSILIHSSLELSTLVFSDGFIRLFTLGAELPGNAA